MDVSISLNLLVFLLFPRPLLRYMGTFRANPVAIWSAIANWGRCCEWGGIFIALIGRYFYCTIPRQFILHLHRYNILRFLWGTQFWVSRSKKMSRQGVAIFGLFRYSLTIYIIPFFNADVLKKSDKKRLFVSSLFLFSF